MGRGAAQHVVLVGGGEVILLFLLPGLLAVAALVCLVWALDEYERSDG